MRRPRAAPALRCADPGRFPETCHVIRYKLPDRGGLRSSWDLAGPVALSAKAASLRLKVLYPLIAKEISVMKNSAPVCKFFSLLAAGAAFALLPLATRGADMPVSGEHDMGSMTVAKSAGEVTVTGEVLDMACYLDHGAQGDKHAGCAQKCISSGLPVGLKGTDGTTYLLIGEHMPANQELAQYAAKTITVKGKLVSRDGLNLLENIEIVK